MDEPRPDDARERRSVYVVDGARTPFIKARSKPNPFTPVDLAVWAGRPLLARQPVPRGSIDDVILGCVNPRHDEVNPGRVAALRLGCGERVPGWTVQRNCASGMQSVDTGYRYIADGRADIVLAGGTEALSHSPLLYNEEAVNWFGDLNRASGAVERARVLGRLRPRFFAPVIGLLCGLTDPFCGLNMGQTAEVLAHRFDIDRKDADAYAARSHQRLADAGASGRLSEIVPMYDAGGDFYDHDDGVRPDSSVDGLSKLGPAFEKPFGEVTAGNSSQITDGACWLLLASADAVEHHGLEVLGRIVASEWAALDPRVMGLGPVFAATPMLVGKGLSRADIDVWEINEAFAAQVLACLDAWQDDEFCSRYLDLDAPFGAIDTDSLNVDGGAISLGHPVGTSGARIVLHCLHALRDRGGRRGVATECIGGGQGGAMLLEVDCDD